MSNKQKNRQLCRRPSYVSIDKQTVDMVLDEIKAGKHVYWGPIQRRFEAWTSDQKRSFIINTINGIRCGTDYTLVEYDSNITYNEKRGKTGDTNWFRNGKKECIDKYGENVVAAIAEGNHRTNVWMEFERDEFALLKGTTLYASKPVTDASLTLEEDMTFSELPPEYQNEFLLAHVPMTIIKGVSSEQLLNTINSINASVPWSRAEKRKLIPGSLISTRVMELEKKWLDKLSGKRLTSGAIARGSLMTFCSRSEYWQHYDTNKDTTEDDLDKFHQLDQKGNALVDKKDYDLSKTQVETVFKAALLKGNPLATYRNGKSIASADMYGFLFLCKALEDISVHPHQLKIKDLEGLINYYGETELWRENNIVATKTIKDFDDCSIEFNKYRKDHSYEYWTGIPHYNAQASKRYDAIRNDLARDWQLLVHKKILLAKEGTYFTKEQKSALYKKQNGLDPLSGKPLDRFTAQAHHAKPVREGGLTILANGVLLNEDTHKWVHNKDNNELPWEELLLKSTELREETLLDIPATQTQVAMSP